MPMVSLLICLTTLKSVNMDHPLSDPHLYDSMVGAFQYASLTRPYVVFIVNKACYFLTSPMETHWSIVKRILRYLGGTINHGFMLSLAPSSCKFSLRAYSNLDWSSDLDDCLST